MGVTVKEYKFSCFRVAMYVLCPIREVLEQVCVAHSLSLADFKEA